MRSPTRERFSAFGQARNAGHAITLSAIALVCAGAAWLLPVGAARIVAVVPVALVLPGRALGSALGTRQRCQQADAWLWDLALSLATLICIGLLLNLTPGGLTRTSWLCGLLAVTLVAALVGARQSIAPRPAVPHPPADRRWRAPKAPAAQSIMALAALALAGALAIGAVVYSTVDARAADERVSFTALSAETQASAAVVEVTSYEQSTTTLRLTVSSAAGGFRELEPFRLEPGGTRQFRIDMSAASGRTRIELLRSGVAGPYRFLTLWPNNGPVPR